MVETTTSMRLPRMPEPRKNLTPLPSKEKAKQSEVTELDLEDLPAFDSPDNLCKCLEKNGYLPSSKSGRNLVVCIDGTSNKYSEKVKD